MPSSRSQRPRCAARALGLALACALAAGPASLRPARAALSRSQELKAQTFNKLNEGKEAYRNGNYRHAIEVLEQVTQVAMNSFTAFYFLGIAYKADRQYLKAIEPLTFALELDPTDRQAHVDLGDCHLKRGDTDEALAEYHRALALQQGYAPAWDGLGRAAEAMGDDDKAIENFKKAIDLNPGFPDASLNLGDLYMRRGRLKEAVDLFLKAIGVRPDFAAAHNRLGVAYARQRLGNEAIAALRRAAELEKGNPWHPYTIGLIEMDFGNLSQAGRELDEAIALDKHYLEAYVAKARLFRRLGDFEAAARVLSEAMEIPSEDEKLKHDVADLHGKILAEGASHRDLTARFDSGAATPEELRSLAELRAATGDHHGAAAALRAIPTRDARDRFRLGYHLLRSSAFEEAEREFSALRDEKPASQAVLINLGLALQGQGKHAAAEAAFEEALRRSPDDRTALTALGNARVLEGKLDEAAEAFQRTIAGEEEFAGRARVETILKALKAILGAGRPSPPPQQGGRR